jgi:hypothetical protein
VIGAVVVLGVYGMVFLAATLLLRVPEASAAVTRFAGRRR